MQSAADRFRAERFTTLLNARSPWQAETGGPVAGTVRRTTSHGNQTGTHADAAQSEDAPVLEWVARTRVQQARPLPRYLRRMSNAAADLRKLVSSFGSNADPT